MIDYGILPLTILRNKYNVYCKGDYVAWNLEPNEIPKYSYSNEANEIYFWNNENKYSGCKRYDEYFGTGDTIQEAIDDLYAKILTCNNIIKLKKEDFNEIIEDIHLV